jgi:hypothetical protein
MQQRACQSGNDCEQYALFCGEVWHRVSL